MYTSRRVLTFIFPLCYENLKTNVGNYIFNILKLAFVYSWWFFVKLGRPFQEMVVAEICELVPKEEKEERPQA